MMLASYGAGVALIEPALLHPMIWPNIVMRPVHPAIESKTWLMRQESVPLSLAMQEFVRHLKATMKSEFDISSCYGRSEEHTSELQSLMRSSYAVFCLKKKNNRKNKTN